MTSFPRNVICAGAARLLGLAVLIGGPATAASAQTLQYELVDLGTLGGRQSHALALNAHGDVVGSSDIALRGRSRRASLGRTHAFLWQQGFMHDLGTLGGAWSEARDINSARQVVGVSATPSGHRRAFYWYDGIMFDLNALLPISPPEDPYDPDLQGGDSMPAIFAPLRIVVEANAISEDGSIVAAGYVSGDPRLQGFLLKPNEPFDPAEPGFTAMDLGLLPGAESAIPLDLNAVGLVVGVSDQQPFLWKDGYMARLEQPATTAVLEGQANAINADGGVAGRSDSGWAWGPRASLWWHGQRFDLTTTPGVVSEANDINDSWQIVGWQVEWDALAGAVLWDGWDVRIELDQVTHITDETQSIFPWSRLAEATGINNQRWISGWGVSTDGRERAFLLVPLEDESPVEDAGD